MLPALIDNDATFHDKLVVIASDDYAHFGFLSSGVHWWWAITGGTTLETRPVYAPERNYTTFPFSWPR